MPDGPIVYLTAGGAGMYCGSCLHDNTLVAALRRRGCEVLLVPLYTPIRTDEHDESQHQVFFGGVNVYLQQRWKLFRLLPKWADRWLDQPWLINLLARRQIQVAARQLGELTVSMLRGNDGNQRKEVQRLVSWLASDIRPSLVVFSNILTAGWVAQLKELLDVPVLVTLQGDDLFLDGLQSPYRQQALDLIGRLGRDVDGYLVASRYYADFMADYLRLPRERFHQTPLGIDTRDFQEAPPASAAWEDGTRQTFKLGYLARICQEKGFHLLVDAFLDLARRPGLEGLELEAAGWLGESDRPFFEAQEDKIRNSGLSDRFHYRGVVSREEKLSFLRSLHLFCVPTVYREPKGLFALEAMAAGVPVVLPEHGALPELLADTGGGRLFPPNDPAALAQTLGELLLDPAQRRALAEAGRAAVFARRNAEQMAEQSLAVFQRIRAI